MDEIKFDKRNYRKHSDTNKKRIAKSLNECGAGRSILIDNEGEIIAGNGVYEQAKAAGIPVRVVETDGSELVVVKRTDLATDDEKRKRLALADNATSDHVEWDMETLTGDFEDCELGEWGIECEVEGVSVGGNETDVIERKKKEFEDRMAQGENLEDNEEYQEFVQKFEAKKTTDDCYTPTIIYEAVAQYVADHYHESRSSFVRPFYPNGDYQKEKYEKGCVVVDNPPFSILSEIVHWYSERNIKFFLFAPSLTILGCGKSDNITAIITNYTITYENGAAVNTSFLTNLENSDIRAKSDPVLARIIKQANEANLKENKKELPKYSFPDNIITSTFLGRLSKYGISFEVKRSECITIGSLDSMKEMGKGIYGSGLLCSDKIAAEKAAAEKAAAEKAAAEKAAAHRWSLSEREREIIKELSKN